MDYKTILENWQKFAQSTKPLTLSESREIMNEISSQAAERIYDWMRETRGLDYDFNEIFGENMRVVFPMDSEDTRMLKGIMRGVRAAGWVPPISEDARDRYRTHMSQTGREPTKEEWAEWESEVHPSSRGFPTKKVKQKKQRLAVDGGGEYEVEINVADLTMERRIEQVIPKGPRAGEKITKVKKQGINKIIGGLEKQGEVPEGSAQWWAKNQTFYTKDANHKKISELLAKGELAEPMHVILSRHPIDVLRMSDISNIHSCHSEGSEYFQCAVAEAKGHGPIAYAVTEAQLNKLLTPSEERERPIAKLDRMYDTMSQAERVTQIRQDYDTGSPEGALVLLWVWSRSNHGSKWWRDLDKRVEMAAKPEKFKEVALISKAKELNISPELFKQYIKNYEDAKAANLPGFKPYEGIISQEEYKAALEKHSEEATRAPDKKDIGDFDDEEIFTDRDRNIDGIGVQSRVRLRKYVDEPNELTFAAPESRTYGRSTPGFVGAVREFVWDKQKEIFAQELGDIDPETGKGEATTYFIPQSDYLTRYGGSYGDTRDGEILSLFFRPGRGPDMDDPYSFGMDVHHDSEGEEEEEANRLYDEYEQAVDDLNDTANNELTHTTFGAHVSEPGWGDQPYVSADGSLLLRIPLGEAQYSIPENTWGGDAREFAGVLDLPSEYPEETNWEVIEGDLEITYRFACEDCSEPDDADYFLDYMRELDGKYDHFYEIIRRKLVEEEYAAKSDWDNTASEIEDLESKLKNFNIIGDDDPDDPTGEIWFNLGVGTGNTNPDVPLDLKLPVKDFYWLTKHSRWGAGYGAQGRNVFHSGGGLPDIVAKAVAGRRERNVVWVGPGTNSSFNRFFREKLKKLEMAANNYASKQIDLPFGDKYAKPAYEGINFAKDTQIGLKFGDAAHRESDTRPIFLKFRVVVKSKDNLEELQGAFHFVEFVDNHMDMILEAAKDITQTFVIDPNVEIAAEIKEEYLSGDKQLAMSKDIIDTFTHDDNLSNHSKAIVEWWSSGDTWSKMNEFEKEIVTDRYLRPMSAGRHIPWDDKKHLPTGWEGALRDHMTHAGVASAILDNLDFKAHANPEITEKHFGTEEERNEKRIEYELKIAKNRWKATHGEDPSEKEVASWRKEIMAALGMGDAAPLRGTMGAPRPAESIDRRVAYLKKQLTEAKIRAKIRRIIKEAE